MIEAEGYFWDSPEEFKVIPTNKSVKKDGKLNMCSGTQKQASQRFPRLATILGEHVQKRGHTPALISEYNIITLPSKHEWDSQYNLDLIRRSAKIVAHMLPIDSTCAITRVGCCNDGLKWKDVKQALSPILDDRFRVYK